MNPRIQVEHTVTEEVTDVDLVQSQMRIAAGETLADLGLSQDTVVLRGAALQCRITTEDPANGFRPDTGKITTYRSPGGAGRPRSTAARRTPARRSPRTSTRCWPSSPAAAATFDERRRPGPARGGGVPDPRRLHQHRVPAGRARRPGLPGRPASPPASSRSTRSCSTAAVQRRPRHQAAHLPRRRHRQPAARPGAGQPRPGAASCRTSTSTVPAPDGTRQQLLALGPEGFAARAARADSASRSPTPRSATPTSRCWPPGCAPTTCSPSPGTSPG